MQLELPSTKLLSISQKFAQAKTVGTQCLGGGGVVKSLNFGVSLGVFFFSVTSLYNAV